MKIQLIDTPGAVDVRGPAQWYGTFPPRTHRDDRPRDFELWYLFPRDERDWASVEELIYAAFKELPEHVQIAFKSGLITELELDIDETQNDTCRKA